MTHLSVSLAADDRQFFNRVKHLMDFDFTQDVKITVKLSTVEMRKITKEVVTKMGLAPTLKICHEGSNGGGSWVWSGSTVMIAVAQYTTKTDQGRMSSVYMTVGATKEEDVLKCVKILEKAMKPHVQAAYSEKYINFWMLRDNGPASFTKTIKAPIWGDIAPNYVNSTKKLLEDLLGIDKDHMADKGKIIIAEGKPGTGKSYFLKALINEWYPWCRAHYIMDPEKFWGSPDYMWKILMEYEDYNNNTEEEVEENYYWKLVIAEDADELISEEAKAKTGQALSRLLNVSEGIIGQGVKALFLITTNEPIDKVHAAVSRSGRCLANIHFDLFDNAQAKEWLSKRNYEGPVEKPTYSLADMYALANKSRVLTKSGNKTKFGFI